MEEAWALGEYLPLSFQSEQEQAYMAFLWDAFQSNYESGKYQFAFLAFHMLTMSFVYCNVWQIKNILADDFGKAMIGFNKNEEKDLLKATSPFAFSRINESVIFRFLKLIGCDNSQIGQYTRLVKDRNEVAHSNGNIYFNAPETLDKKLAERLRLVKEIQQQSKPIILHCYETFLKESCDPEERQYLDHQDQIREVLIHQNYLSQKDIEFCLEHDITCLSNEAHFVAIEALHQTFIAAYYIDEA